MGTRSGGGDLQNDSSLMMSGAAWTDKRAECYGWELGQKEMLVSVLSSNGYVANT